MVDVESYDWKQVCEIVDRLESYDSFILCECIRMLCANSSEASDCLIGQYGDILEEEDDD